MSNSIVTAQVTQTVAPEPETLQETGALVSQGGTTLAQNASALLTLPSDLTPLLAAPLTLTGITQTGGLATAVASALHGITVGDSFLTTIAGSGVAGYNGTFRATATTTSDFTYAVPTGTASPSTGSATYTPRGVVEIQLMVTSYFAQGSLIGVYVLEMGAGEDTAAIAALSTYLTNNPNSSYEPGETGFYYAYLVPRNWANDSTFLTLVEQYESTTAKTYFFTTMTTDNYTSFTVLMKSVFGQIEAPGVSLTEFSVAADFYQFLVNDPSSTNRVAQFAFRFLFGVTPYPIYNNSALLATLKAAKVNVVGTGNEGGISTALIKWGTTMDGRQATYWYSVDWIQLNADLDVANAVINGSQNGPNPLYFNQEGINRLQLVGAQTLGRAISYGLGLGGATVATPELDPDDFNAALDAGTYNGQLVINAVPFLPYVEENPSDYSESTYNGLEVVYITQNGFIAIRFNINVTDFVAAP